MISKLRCADRRILVLGAGGFIGSHIVSRLSRYDWKIRALDLNKPLGVHDQCDWIVGSVLDEKLVASASTDCDTVIYLAASSLPGTGDADIAAEIGAHVHMAVKTAEICSAQGVRTYIFASSGGTVYGEGGEKPLTETSYTQPLTAYGASKLAIENYLYILSRRSGMRTVCLRISNPFGPSQKAMRNQGFIAAAISASFEGKPLKCWGDGSVVRDFVFIDDVADAFVNACLYEGKSCVINIGCGRGRSLMDVISTIEIALGTKIEVEFFPSRSFDVKANVLNISLAESALSWTPNVGFEAGLDRTIFWWRNNTQIDLREKGHRA